jgi:hypothetical protein
MKIRTATQWIKQFLQQDPPRAKSVVMTVFGNYAARWRRLAG